MKPATFWCGRPSNYDEDEENERMKRQTSFEQKLYQLSEFVMMDRWVPISRECAILVDSSLKLWTVFAFAMLSIVLLFYEVSISLKVHCMCNLFVSTLLGSET